jgi:signal transduction histidine kinase
MKIKLTNPAYHILYWILVALILALVFGRSWGNRTDAIYFVSFLLPAVIGTSYFFNYYLVPTFLLRKKYAKFVVYFFYLLIVSLLLELIVLILSIILLAQYKVEAMSPNSLDTLLMAFVLYMIVFLGSFLYMILQWNHHKQEISHLKQEQAKLKKSFLQLVSNRQNKKIPYNDITYIESLAAYIKVNTVQGEEVTSKEKISEIEKRLPETFMRIHRSFIVNSEKISGFNYSGVTINGTELTIGRSYKKQVMSCLKQK